MTEQISVPLSAVPAPTDTVFLVDGSGYIFRAFYAVTSLSTKSGFPTNALYGFVRMLGKLLQGANSQYVTVVFDSGRETFRKELYAEYKANRSECPPDLSLQMPYFRKIVRALGLKDIELPGYEADDIIGTLSCRLAEAGVNVVLVTGDKDLMQLVGDRVTIWDTMKDVRIGESQVIEKFGVPPSKVVEILGLTGDSSDNIPGLKGVGPKTAAQLIEYYGDIEGIISNVGGIKEDARIKNRKKIAEQIESGLEILRLSRQLAQINTKSPVYIEESDYRINVQDLEGKEILDLLRCRPPVEREVRDLFEELEFTSLLKGLNLQYAKPAPPSTPAGNYITVTGEGFAKWAEEFNRRSFYAIDLETTSLDVLEAKIVGIAICWSADESFYLPVGHVVGEDQIPLELFLETCGASLLNPEIAKCGQNLKYDMGVLAQHGIEVKGARFDTMIAAYLLNSDRRAYNLEALASEYLGRGTVTYKETVGDKADFSMVEIADATIYAAEDAHLSWLLTEVLSGKIREEGLTKVLDELEMPLVSVLSRMERRGVKLDCNLLAALSEEYGQELDRIRSEIFQIAGTEFNLNSTKQLAELLFDRLGLPTKGIKKTKTGISTDSSVLEKLADVHPLPRLILEYRALQKLKSTYVDALPAQVSPLTGRLHCKLNQAVTGTGRLSSSEPNLQNIPVQTKEGRRIRDAFVAEEGSLLISADYSQIELRVLAALSEDEEFIRAFMDEIDIHEKTAREIMNIPAEGEVPPELRRIGKTINFGVIYGMSGFRLGAELGIPVGIAQEYINNYFARYPRVKQYFKRLEEDAVRSGAVSTLFGRRRIISDLDTSGRDKGFALRAAINAPIQGTAADIIKLAMVRLEERIEREELPFKLILQIHDELLFECKREFVDEATEIIRQEMEQVIELKVPLKVDVGVGGNWQEAHA